MDILGTILWPLKWIVELLLVGWHWLFSALGLDPAAGITWALAVVGLVLVVRAALIPVFVRQINSQRRMLEVAPELKKIQDKYRGKRDQLSREAMSRETMDLYKRTGTNPLSSCLPLLLQLPIFFALFSVLNDAQYGKAGVGPLNEALAAQFGDAKLFGVAPLHDSFASQWSLMVAGQPFEPSVMWIAATMVVLMTASQFITQLQIVSKNMSPETKASPMFRQQRILLYLLPLVFAFSGVAFPLGVMIYWLTSNIWTMAQQFIVIRNMPTPGSEAAKAREERLARKGEPAATQGESERAPRLQPRWFIVLFWKVHRAMVRVTGGRLGLWQARAGRWGAMRLTTIGRRSGQERSVIVGYFEDGPNLVTMAMNGWGEPEPAWWLNLQSHPQARVQLTDGTRQVVAHAATGAERARLWDRWRSLDKDLDGYARRRPTETAVVVFEPRP